ncbi:MAG TPA: glycoside hydrolase family 47 protein [Pyrinomonadaceae bacterium]|nr:glycoside hydrolase family 47 protein [Pyrinomonadaceae bacterium]
MRFSATASLVILFGVTTVMFGQGAGRRATAEQVKAEFLHAWNGYKKYAWGKDDLKPLSKSYHNWYAEPLLMTPVDALDTMYLMGLKAEADTTRKHITDTLKFDKDLSVQKFEIVIRLLGGLLSSYQMTGDEKLLALADDLGTRLLPAFESPTGLPYKHVNLQTGKVSTAISNPAETGTLLIEFGTLSKLTGKPIYYEKAKRALVETYKRRSPIGLVGTRINVETGEWTNTGSHVSAEIDSYYEYLYKCWKLFADKECKAMWETSIPAVHKYLADELGGELWYGHADMVTGKRSRTTYGALDAFFPGLLAISGDLARAKRLQDSSFKMWKVHGIEPEVYDYKTGEVLHPGYPLRPEIVESTYILYQLTKDPKYQAMGERLWKDFVRHCRTEAGYAHLKSVVTKEKSDAMQSFVMAETFKYFFLLFAPDKTLDFRKVVFNTEAHPIRRTWKD